MFDRTRRTALATIWTLALVGGLLAVAPRDPSPAMAQEPAPVPTPTPQPLAAVKVEPAELTAAKIDGRWHVVEETASVTATIRVDGAAKWVDVDVLRVPFTDENDLVSVIPLPTEAGRLFGLAAAPGRYLVTVQCFDPELGPATDRSFITIEGPDPPDPPKPPDPPTPEPGKRFILIVEESDELTVAQADTITDIRAEIDKAAKHSMLVLDDDTVGPDGRRPDWLTPYLDLAGTTRPCVFIVDPATAKVLHTAALPATAAEFFEQLRKAGG